MRVRTTEDEWTIQGDYGQGWEDLTTELTRKLAQVQLKAYRENAPGQYRLIKRRVKIKKDT